MILADTSIRRPVVCIVASLVVVLVGVLSFVRLPVREYPSTDSPIVSVDTFYRGASAEVMESRVTQPLEEQLSTIDGVRVMRSNSGEQSSRISIEFALDRDVDAAANDVRDRVARARGSLPAEIDEPVVSKVDADANPFMFLSLRSDTLSVLELADYAERIIKPRLQTIPGMGPVALRASTYAMRVWLDAARLAAFKLTAADVERALRQQNVEIPGGRIESLAREFPIRVEGDLNEVADFENVVLAVRDGHPVKLRDVGRVEVGARDRRVRSYFLGQPNVSIALVRQSQSNLLEVAAGVRARLAELQPRLPAGMSLSIGFDSTVFVQRSVDEVFRTIFEAVALVIVVIFAFLRDWRATLIPLVAIPVSILGTFAAMAALGFTINILTLLALVLAIGLVVDDAIVMLENIYHRIESGENPVAAAVHGSRQMAFAIIATTLVLVAVFLPVAFQRGATGRLFYEFGITLAMAVSVSGFVALTLTPMLSSRMLRGHSEASGASGRGWMYRVTEPVFVRLNEAYAATLRWALRRGWVVVAVSGAVLAGGLWAYPRLPRELVPLEDRGVLFASFLGPQGSTPAYTELYGHDMRRIVESLPEHERNVLIIGFGAGNRLFMPIVLSAWEDRERTTQEVVAELRRRFNSEISGGLALVIPIRPLGQRGFGESFQVALRGTDYGELQATADRFAAAMRGSGLFLNPRVEPSPVKPQLDVEVDRALAADLRVQVSEIASTLETLFGGRRASTFKKNDQQYDVILQVDDGDRSVPSDLGRVFVRSQSDALVPLSSLVRARETAVPENYLRIDKIRAVTIGSTLAQGRTIGDAVEWVAREIAAYLPPGYDYRFEGETREFIDSSRSTAFLFSLAIVFSYLILAAQFESWVHPVTIFTAVGIALAGGILTLWTVRQLGQAVTNNLFSQFGLILLIGLVAKNGILIVEFANQLQIAGRGGREAAREAAALRFRPIVMTAISTISSALPLAFASGAGAEVRNALGLVVVGGLALATLLSLYLVPVVYAAFDAVARRITGRSSAQGLIRAAQIEREVIAAARESRGAG